MINFDGGIFLLGGGNLTNSDFDYLENIVIQWGRMNLWWGKQKFGGGNFSWWMRVDEQIFGQWGDSPHPPSRENPACMCACVYVCIYEFPDDNKQEILEMKLFSIFCQCTFKQIIFVVVLKSMNNIFQNTFETIQFLDWQLF